MGKIYYEENKLHGQGILTWPNGAVDNGEFVYGKREGHGKCTYADGRQYEGSWKDDLWHGYGHATYPNGDSYEGEFKFGQLHGRGNYKWSDGRAYDGSFVEDKRHGHGIFTWPDGAVYNGEFVNGKQEGHGKRTYADGGQYDGSWKDGLYDGFGTYTWEDGRRYRGEWRNGMALRIQIGDQDGYEYPPATVNDIFRFLKESNVAINTNPYDAQDVDIDNFIVLIRADEFGPNPKIQQILQWQENMLLYRFRMQSITARDTSGNILPRYFATTVVNPDDINRIYRELEADSKRQEREIVRINEELVDDFERRDIDRMNQALGDLEDDIDPINEPP